MNYDQILQEFLTSDSFAYFDDTFSDWEGSRIGIPFSDRGGETTYYVYRTNKTSLLNKDRELRSAFSEAYRSLLNFYQYDYRNSDVESFVSTYMTYNQNINCTYKFPYRSGSKLLVLIKVPTQYLEQFEVREFTDSRSSQYVTEYENSAEFEGDIGTIVYHIANNLDSPEYIVEFDGEETKVKVEYLVRELTKFVKNVKKYAGLNDYQLSDSHSFAYGLEEYYLNHIEFENEALVNGYNSMPDVKIRSPFAFEILKDPKSVSDNVRNADDDTRFSDLFGFAKPVQSTQSQSDSDIERVIGIVGDEMEEWAREQYSHYKRELYDRYKNQGQQTFQSAKGYAKNFNKDVIQTAKNNIKTGKRYKTCSPPDVYGPNDTDLYKAYKTKAEQRINKQIIDSFHDNVFTEGAEEYNDAREQINDINLDNIKSIRVQDFVGGNEPLELIYDEILNKIPINRLILLLIECIYPERCLDFPVGQIKVPNFSIPIDIEIPDIYGVISNVTFNVLETLLSVVLSAILQALIERLNQCEDNKDAFSINHDDPATPNTFLPDQSDNVDNTGFLACFNNDRDLFRQFIDELSLVLNSNEFCRLLQGNVNEETERVIFELLEKDTYSTVRQNLNSVEKLTECMKNLGDTLRQDYGSVCETIQNIQPERRGNDYCEVDDVSDRLAKQKILSGKGLSGDDIDSILECEQDRRQKQSERLQEMVDNYDGSLSSLMSGIDVEKELKKELPDMGSDDNPSFQMLRSTIQDIESNLNQGFVSLITPPEDESVYDYEDIAITYRNLLSQSEQNFSTQEDIQGQFVEAVDAKNRTSNIKNLPIYDSVEQEVLTTVLENKLQLNLYGEIGASLESTVRDYVDTDNIWLFENSYVDEIKERVSNSDSLDTRKQYTDSIDDTYPLVPLYHDVLLDFLVNYPMYLNMDDEQEYREYYKSVGLPHYFSEEQRVNQYIENLDIEAGDVAANLYTSLIEGNIETYNTLDDLAEIDSVSNLVDYGDKPETRLPVKGVSEGQVQFSDRKVQSVYQSSGGFLIEKYIKVINNNSQNEFIDTVSIISQQDWMSLTFETRQNVEAEYRARIILLEGTVSDAPNRDTITDNTYFNIREKYQENNQSFNLSYFTLPIFISDKSIPVSVTGDNYVVAFDEIVPDLEQKWKTFVANVDYQSAISDSVQDVREQYLSQPDEQSDFEYRAELFEPVQKQIDDIVNGNLMGDMNNNG